MFFCFQDSATSSTKEETCGQVELWQLRLRWSFHPSPSANEGNSRWMMGNPTEMCLENWGDLWCIAV